MLKRWSATSQRLLPWVAALAALAVLAWPVLDPDVQLFYRDTGRFHYPLKKYMTDRLLSGHLPLWDPWTEAGVSVLGQMSPGLFHPWTLLYLALPFDLAFKLNHLLPLLLAFGGTYLLARRLGASRTAATAGGLIYGTCGYLVSQASANVTFVIGPAGIPIALERFVALLDRPSRTRLLAASALLALCAYAGEPQSMLMCGVIGAAFALSRAVSRGERPWRSARLLFAWGALALALAAPVALPAAYQLGRSSRAAGLTQYELQRFSVPPARFPGLFVARAFEDQPLDEAVDGRTPLPFDEYFTDSGFAASLYLGSSTLLLACFAVFAGRRGRFFLLASLVFVLASAGDDLGLQRILRVLIPGYGLFRYAEKQIAFASLTFAVAAALGLDAAFARRTRIAALGIAAAACGLCLGLASALFRHDPAWLQQFLLDQGSTHCAEAATTFAGGLAQGLALEAQFVAVIAAAAFLCLLRQRFPARAVATATAATALVVSGSPHLTTIPVAYFHDEPVLAQELLHVAGPSTGRWRLYTRPDLDIAVPALDNQRSAALRTRDTLRPQFNGLFDIESISDYFSAGDVDYARLLAANPPQTFDLLTVRFFLAMPQSMSPAKAKELNFERTHFDMWLLTLPPRPRARLLDHVEPADSIAAIGERMRDVDINRTALLLPADGEAAASVHPAASSPKTPRYSRPSPEEIDVQVDAATTSVLEVGEHYDRGWRVRVDGKAAKALAVDGFLLGAVVPKGTHSVQLRFRPTGFFEGFAIALAAIAALLVTRRVRALTLSVTGRSRETSLGAPEGE